MITLSLTQGGKVLNEQPLFAIYHLGGSCNPPGRVGSGIGKVDSESHQVQFSFKVTPTTFWLKSKNLPKCTKFCSTRKLEVAAKNLGLDKKSSDALENTGT